MSVSEYRMVGNCRVYGESLGPQPDWPRQRGLALVNTKHEYNNKKLFEAGCPNSFDIHKILRSQDIIIDIGCGVGQYGAELKRARPNVQVWLAGAHDVLEENIKAVDRVYYGYLPSTRKLLEDACGRANIVETYGSTTYSDNPGHSTVHNIACCGDNSHFSILSSAASTDEDTNSVYGTVENWGEIKEWIINNMDVNPSIIDTTIKSDITGQYMIDFLVRGQVQSHTFNADDFDWLCAKFDADIGVPTRGVTWFTGTPDNAPADKPKFNITAFHWPKDIKPSQEEAVAAN